MTPPPPSPGARPDLAAALLLADGRFPSGAHAHSFGLESAVAARLVADLDDLLAWSRGCLHTGWQVEAGAAAMAQAIGAAAMARTAVSRRAEAAVTATTPPDLGALRTGDRWSVLDTELTARTPSPVLRRAWRTLGRQLLRTGRATWPAALGRSGPLAAVGDVHPDGPLAPLALGALAAAAGLDAPSTATVALHQAVMSAGTAVVRLLGLDPFAVTGLAAGLAPDVAEVAQRVADLVASGPDPPDPRLLPHLGTPMVDILLAAHDRADARLFTT